MALGLDKANRNSYYAIFNIRSEDLDTKGTTTLDLADSVLFFVPKDADAYARHINTERYKKSFAKYLPDYSLLPGTDWNKSFSHDMSKEGELTAEDVEKENIKRTYANNKLKIEGLSANSVSESRDGYGIYRKTKDVCYTLDYTVISTDEHAFSGINILNDYGVMYYFLMNPLTKKYFVGYRKNGKYFTYHGSADEGNPDIPDVGVAMHVKIIMQNLELAFIINDKIIASYGLTNFAEINTGRTTNIHTEGITTIEATGLAAASSPNDKTNRDLDALAWHRPANTGVTANNGNGLPRSLVGTIVLWGESTYTDKKFGQVFEIWGDPMATGQSIYGRMIKNADPSYTYRTYTWRLASSSYQVTKGWDLRDYANKGTFFTNGDKVQ